MPDVTGPKSTYRAKNSVAIATPRYAVSSSARAAHKVNTPSYEQRPRAVVKSWVTSGRASPATRKLATAIAVRSSSERVNQLCGPSRRAENGITAMLRWLGAVGCVAAFILSARRYSNDATSWTNSFDPGSTPCWIRRARNNSTENNRSSTEVVLKSTGPGTTRSPVPIDRSRDRSRSSRKSDGSIAIMPRVASVRQYHDTSCWTASSGCCNSPT